MGDIRVDPKGVAKLLDELNVHKAPGPDGLNARVLIECRGRSLQYWHSSTMSPQLGAIYQMNGNKQMFLWSLKLHSL